MADVLNTSPSMSSYDKSFTDSPSNYTMGRADYEEEGLKRAFIDLLKLTIPITITSLFVSLLTIVFSLTLYDHRTLNRDIEDTIGCYILYICNFFYRFLSVTARIIILSFLIALFPWYLLFAILLIPIIAYSGPYQLGNSDAEPLNLIYQSLLVFPDYSAPFGKISETETYLNNIHRIHLFIIIIFGAPLIIIFIIVEKIVNKILKIDSETISMNKDKYASFRITTYTLSRFVESTIELLIISAELFSPLFEAKLFISDWILVDALFWTSVILTILAPIPFFKFYDDFVVDNEEDYELWYGVNEDNNNNNNNNLGGFKLDNDDSHVTFDEIEPDWNQNRQPKKGFYAPEMSNTHTAINNSLPSRSFQQPQYNNQYLEDHTHSINNSINGVNQNHSFDSSLMSDVIGRQQINNNNNQQSTLHRQLNNNNNDLNDSSQSS
eukprot:529457_1